MTTLCGTNQPPPMFVCERERERGDREQEGEGEGPCFSTNM